jgi:hypothetical protein
MKRTTQKNIALTAIFVIELIAGALGGAITAAILLPLAYAERGNWAFGAEWLIITLAAFGAFYAVHSKIFKVLGEEAQR